MLLRHYMTSTESSDVTRINMCAVLFRGVVMQHNFRSEGIQFVCYNI